MVVGGFGDRGGSCVEVAMRRGSEGFLVRWRVCVVLGGTSDDGASAVEAGVSRRKEGGGEGGVVLK